MTKTITAGVAEDLSWRDEGSEVAGWKKVADQEIREHRWGTSYWLVLMELSSSTLWGLSYFSGATEMQENDYPWDEKEDADEIELTRLYSFTREVVEYTDKP